MCCFLVEIVFVLLSNLAGILVLFLDFRPKSFPEFILGVELKTSCRDICGQARKIKQMLLTCRTFREACSQAAFCAVCFRVLRSSADLCLIY